VRAAAAMTADTLHNTGTATAALLEASRGAFAARLMSRRVMLMRLVGHVRHVRFMRRAMLLVAMMAAVVMAVAVAFVDFHLARLLGSASVQGHFGSKPTD